MIDKILLFFDSLNLIFKYSRVKTRENKRRLKPTLHFEHEGRLLEIINTPKDQMNPSTIEEGLVTASVHYRQLHLCKDNVYSLISQLDKFKHPNKLTFNLQHIE